MLETDCEGVKNRLLIEDDYIKLLDSLPKQIKISILEPFGVSKTNELPRPLTSLTKMDILSIGYLKEFTSQLTGEIAIEYLKEGLVQRGLLEEVEKANKLNRTIYAFMLSQIDIELLQMSYLVSRCEKFAYEEYLLLMDMETISDPLKQAELRQIEQTGIVDPTITTDLVNGILERYELSNSTNLSSTCLKILHYNNEILIFILRESQRGGLRTFQKYIVDMNADLIVFRFSPTLKDLRVRAVSIVKEEVYQTIANNIIINLDQRLPANYVKRSNGNSSEVFQAFLQSLLVDSVPGVQLNLIEFVAPLPGKPLITVEKKSGEISLIQSLEDTSRNVTLSLLIPDSTVKKVKVSFIINKKSHIFTFYFSEVSEQIYITISGTGGGTQKKRNLISLLHDYTDARIVESKEK
ncbi:hypothetical protein DFQ00_10774 [Paenibacillus barcinonensis]|uniref:Uncharacterized protein n=1 Tax=Paenibacillus barcinonensis TaxID=198119 RepID=A0A2V4V9N6_PAEBA|nr:hypothetical protein DFQ00_10774 [Paenibacillus barcinonensis]